MTKSFIDSNIAVHANDSADPRKQAVASKKLGQSREVITREIFLLERIEVVTVSGETVRNALDLAERYVLSFWDAVILSAAQSALCDTLLSEDFSAGRS